MTYRLSALARHDLHDIADYLAERNAETARRVLSEIRGRLKLLASQPSLGAPRNDLRIGLRCSVVRKYVIYYQTAEDFVDILRVVHGARDINAMRLE